MADFLESRGVDKFVDIHDNNGKYKQISWCADDELIYDQLINWIASLPDNKPFFGFLIPMNTHHPFWTPKKKLNILPENNKVDRYINAMHYQDSLLGKLFLYLKKSNKLDNTIVLITGDHGAVFKTLDQVDVKTSSYLFDNTPYRVPLYIYTPFKTPFKLETDIIGSHIDILPTILDILGINCEKQVQGRSLFDPKIKNRISFIYTDYYKHIVAGLNGNFYMVRDMTEDLTVLSKSLSFHPDICKDSEELCNRIKAKVDEFDRDQNQRLYNYF
jgi:phosphoglycerol transferase MdoB-like AlkP superfamily enzyme